MFGIEKYLIFFNIALCMVLSLVLGVYIYDSNIKQFNFFNENFSQILGNQKQIIDNSITSNAEILKSVKTLENVLSANQTLTLKHFDDINNNVNSINNNINSINDKFKKLPKPVFCQFLN